MEEKNVLAKTSVLVVGARGIKIAQGSKNNLLQGIDSYKLPRIKRTRGLGIS